ncbi:MAG TPA: NAD+ synthase [Pseudobdellovibrionaceae bacterium]|nr:NAD+ synthase [Pseudobdellovibrionaceae bacterium]
MRIALAQINSTLGDFSANAEKMLEFVARAQARRCDLIVFPELSLAGYPPNDLLEREDFVTQQTKALRDLHRRLPKGVGVLLGAITAAGRSSTVKADSRLQAGSLSRRPYFNSAVFLVRGQRPQIISKHRLPNYDVFDEARHLQAGAKLSGLVKWKGRKLRVSICEDMWGWLDGDPSIRKLPRRGTDLFINMSGSPFTRTKLIAREEIIKRTAQHFRAPVLYVNMVGAQDELIFDGRSMVFSAEGKCLSRLAACEEDLGVYDWITGETGDRPAVEDIEVLRRALVLGIRDFARKTGMSKVHFGLSGGIDSAVVACLSVDALGPQSVTAITMPGPFNDPRSLEVAQTLGRRLGIRMLNMPIESTFKTMSESVRDALGLSDFGIVHENLQARIRGTLLMAVANAHGSLLLNTGNKSEYAAGYTTLYGDQCGGLAPLGDLLKREVYALAEYYNRQYESAGEELIPRFIIDRPPSAELRPNQKDQDSLPPYEELDAAVENIVQKRKLAKNKTEKWLVRALAKSEFKRWQAPPVLKVSDHAFGRGRRMPIAGKFEG